MTMVITLSFLGLEGQISSSLEDDGIGHGYLHSSKEEGGHGHPSLLLRDWKSSPPVLEKNGP